MEVINRPRKTKSAKAKPAVKTQIIPTTHYVFGSTSPLRTNPPTRSGDFYLKVSFGDGGGRRCAGFFQRLYHCFFKHGFVFLSQRFSLLARRLGKNKRIRG